MADKKGGIAKKVRDAVESVVTEAGYSIWDVSYYKEGAEMILEIAIDKKGGISINDCSVVTRLVEPIIDELDPIEERYCLEVSSAGTVRNLTRDEHILFAREQGIAVTVGLFVPVEGSKEHSGVVTDFDGSNVTLLCGEKTLTFDKKQITKINAEFVPEDPSEEDGDTTHQSQGEKQ